MTARQLVVWGGIALTIFFLGFGLVIMSSPEFKGVLSGRISEAERIGLRPTIEPTPVLPAKYNYRSQCRPGTYSCMRT